MTPMQILKNNFEVLSNNLSTNFSEANLNKAQSREKVVQKVDDDYLLSFPDEETNFEVFNKKAVESDFVKFFKAKSKKENNSIGFHFVYIEKEKKDFSIKVSLKTVDKNNGKEWFTMSEEMKVDVFKEKLNQLNKLTTLNNDMENVITEVKNIFKFATKPSAKRV